MHTSLFAGRDLALDYHSGGHDVSIVTFEARNKYIDAIKPSPFGPGFGRGIFAKQGYNEFLVKRSRNHWYQVDEISDVISLITEHAKGTKIITYGSSMGGFAAVNFSGLLGASSFIALSPLYDIKKGGEVEDNRWGDEPRILDFKYNLIRDGRCKSSFGYVFYGDNEIDARHASCIARETKGVMIGVEYGGHPCSFYLNDAYGLKRLVNEIAHGEFYTGKFRRVIAENTPKTYYPHLKRSRECEGANDIDGAISNARKAIGFASDRADLKRHLGNLLLARGDLGEAEDALRAAIDISPRDSFTHIRLSYVHAAKEDFERAAQAVQTAIRIDGERPEYHVRLGEWLLKKGDQTGAGCAMSQAILLSPSSTTARVRLSHVCAARGDFPKAVNLMREAIALAPERADYHVRLGEWLIRSGSLAAAEAAMEAAIRINPAARHPHSRLKAIRKLMSQERETAPVEPTTAAMIPTAVDVPPPEISGEADPLPMPVQPTPGWLKEAAQSMWLKAALAGAAGAAMFEWLGELVAFTQ